MCSGDRENKAHLHPQEAQSLAGETEVCIDNEGSVARVILDRGCPVVVAAQAEAKLSLEWGQGGFTQVVISLWRVFKDEQSGGLIDNGNCRCKSTMSRLDPRERGDWRQGDHRVGQSCDLDLQPVGRQ